jgi:sterol desaturase/sphingolipid hydroxylase (fatty acid hydroxylase superfamily)
VTEPEFQAVRAAGFAVALALAVALQRLVPHAASRGSWRVNGAMWVLNAAVLGLVCGACVCAAARWAAQAGVGVMNVAAAPLLVAFPATVLALDLVSYGWHRANHRIVFLWRFHQVHHSDAAFTVSTGLRFHPGELLLSLPLRLAAVVLIGAPVAAVAVFEVTFTLANLIEHGDIDLRAGVEDRLALLLVTPALHRRHHARERAWLNSNFGTIFTLWDRLFGTYGPSSSRVRVGTGLPGMTAPLGLGGTLLLPSRLTPRGQ